MHASFFTHCRTVLDTALSNEEKEWERKERDDYLLVTLSAGDCALPSQKKKIEAHHDFFGLLATALYAFLSRT